jgi:alpha-ketoglutarate-dependent taurine dioxygenase
VPPEDNSAQPLHTDGAYYLDSPDTVVFYCERQAVSGGATIFLDVADLERAVRIDRPTLYEKLVSIRVSFSKSGQQERRSCILDHDAGGPKVNWNYFRVTPGQGNDVVDMCEKFHAYLQERFVDTADLLPLRLEEGEVVIFRDIRVLHGRHSYAADAAGDRLIWKCYFNLKSDKWPRADA